MSISKVFYTLIDDKNTIFQNAEFHSDHIIFRARLRNSMKKCPCCKSFDIRIKETKERTFRMLNLGKKRTQLKIDVHKVWCQSCDKKAWMELPFTSGKLPMTISFMLYIIQLTAMTTLLAVALFLGLQWKTVKNIDKAHLKKKAKQFSYKKLRYISIDEIAIKKGHKYMTIFTDIATGQIIHAVEGRDEKALRPFLRLLAKKAKRLRAIGIDMSAAYASSVRIHLPNVSIVYDRFHVTKLLNNTIDKIRRAEYTNYQNKGLRVLKGQRFLLLRNFMDLATEQKSSLQTLLEVNARGQT
jgi:transposase